MQCPSLNLHIEHEEFSFPPPVWAHAYLVKLGYISTSEEKKTKQRPTPGKLWMLTLAPDPKKNIPVPTYHTLVKKRLKKKWIKSYKYCFELTKKGNFHVHILLETELKRMYEVKRGFVLPDTNFDIHKQDTIEKGTMYLMGYKQGEKKPMFEQDIEFRKKYNLQDIYESE